MTTGEPTPEQKALVARRTLLISAKASCLSARGNGVTDDRIKKMILSMRAPEIAVLSDEEASILIRYLNLEGA